MQLELACGLGFKNHVVQNVLSRALWGKAVGREVNRAESGFETFAETAEPRLRIALVARYGPDIGSQATVDALTHGWKNWDRVQQMENPFGFLYRVGRNRAVRLLPRRGRPRFPDVDPGREPWVEPGLPDALGHLTPKQRQVVVLIHAFEWTQAEVAELLAIRPTTVQNHLERGLTKLRNALKVNDYA